MEKLKKQVQEAKRKGWNDMTVDIKTLEKLQNRIAELEQINEEHRKINGELQEKLKKGE